MNKKLVITLSIIFGILAVVLILLWTLFGLSSVSVEFHSTTQNLTVTEEEIVQAGQFRSHACVLFESKKRSIENIENYVSKNENFAYINVLNIETVFPNKFVIHISEREEIFAIESGDSFYVCDHEFRVLRVASEFVTTDENAILLSGVTVKNESVSVGDFLEIEETGLKNVYSALVKNNRPYSEQISTFESFEVSKLADSVTGIEYYDLEIATFSGKKLVVKNIDFALEEKFQKLFAVQSTLYLLESDENGNLLDSGGQIIYLSQTDDGYYVTYDESYGNMHTLTLDLLSKTYLLVDNLTLSPYVERTTADIYYALAVLS